MLIRRAAGSAVCCLLLVVVTLSAGVVSAGFLTPAHVARREHREKVLKARTLYQSPSSGNSEFANSAKPTTIAEIDFDDYEWTGDRPHDESFFFPSECDPATGKCCLSYNDEECGGTTRGVCTNITASDTTCKQTAGLFWFTDYFDYACVCKGNYWGVACEECKLGWEGDDCETRAPLLVRRDFAKLSDVDKQYVIDGFRLAKLTPSPFQPNVSVFDFWAAIHHWSLPGGVANSEAVGLLTDISEGHVGSGAIPYHRALVAGIEKAIQYALGNKTFALPYWNWTNSAGNDNDLTLKWFGGDGANDEMGIGVSDYCRQSAPNLGWMAECDCKLSRGPFRHWPLVGDWAYPLNDTIERAFGCHTLWAPSTPFQPAADCAIMVDQFDMPTLSFSSKNTRAAFEVEASAEGIRQREWSRTAVKAGTTLYSAGAVFHNLLGGGFLCDGFATWPQAGKETDLHERTHRWLSGTLLGHHPASDPLFWMLHGYADVIFEQWVRNADYLSRLNADNAWSATHGPLGHTRYECQGPLFPLAKQWLSFNDSRFLGFTYDIFNDKAETPLSRPKYHDTKWNFVYPEQQTITYPSTVKLVSQATGVTPTDTSFFFPFECATDSSSCCPLFDGEVCGGQTHGECRYLNSSEHISLVEHPYQLWWVESSFNQVCFCVGNYDGVNCGSCKPGYSGASCEIKSALKVRRNFNQLDDDSRQYIVNAFVAAKHASSLYHPSVSVLQHFASLVYWMIPGNTYADISDEEPHTAYAWHGALPWRRELLVRLESELGRITNNDSFVLPYWDWSNSMNNDNEAFYRWFAGDGDTNSTFWDDQTVCRVPTRDGMGGCNCTITRAPFPNLAAYGNFGVKIGHVQRAFACLGAVSASLPTPDVVDYALTIDTYYASGSITENFAKTMTGMSYSEGVHSWPHGHHGDMMARVQNYIAGTMTTPALDKYRSRKSTPGSDPMYYIALAFSDLIFERWMKRALANDWSMLLPTTEAERGNNRNEAMPGFFPLKTNQQAFVTSDAMGYTYDFLEALAHLDATPFDE